MSFKKNKYAVLRNVLSTELSGFIYKYFLLKRTAAKTLLDEKHISPYNVDWGGWTDAQIPNTYSAYGDVAMDTLLAELKPLMEKETGLKLYETYSYARIYKKGDVLKRHKDRFSCEISTTLNLGGDPWPIYLEPSGETGKAGVQIDLNPGDMLIYKGELLEHWRAEFPGENCGQVFLHYNNAEGPDAKKNKYDTRPHLGLPSSYKSNLHTS